MAEYPPTATRTGHERRFVYCASIFADGNHHARILGQSDFTRKLTADFEKRKQAQLEAKRNRIEDVRERLFGYRRDAMASAGGIIVRRAAYRAEISKVEETRKRLFGYRRDGMASDGGEIVG